MVQYVGKNLHSIRAEIDRWKDILHSIYREGDDIVIGNCTYTRDYAN